MEQQIEISTTNALLRKVLASQLKFEGLLVHMSATQQAIADHVAELRSGERDSSCPNCQRHAREAGNLCRDDDDDDPLARARRDLAQCSHFDRNSYTIAELIARLSEQLALMGTSPGPVGGRGRLPYHEEYVPPSPVRKSAGQGHQVKFASMPTAFDDGYALEEPRDHHIGHSGYGWSSDKEHTRRRMFGSLPVHDSSVRGSERLRDYHRMFGELQDSETNLCDPLDLSQSRKVFGGLPNADTTVAAKASVTRSVAERKHMDPSGCIDRSNSPHPKRL